MSPPYNAPSGALLMVTGACLCTYSLYITILFFRRVSFSCSLNWFSLIIASIWAIMDAFQHARDTTSLPSFYLSSRTAFLGSGGGFLFLLRCFCAYLYENLIVDSKIKSSSMPGILRWRMKADVTRDIAQMVMLFGVFVFPFWEDPESSPEMKIVGTYVVCVLARVAAIGCTVAFFRASLSTGRITPNPSMIVRAMEVSLVCGTVQLFLELCNIVGPGWLTTLSAVSLQAGIAAMLLVSRLELRHRAMGKALLGEVS